MIFLLIKQKSWLYVIFFLLLLFGSSIGYAQSPGRISEKLTAEWAPPAAIEYFEFISQLEPSFYKSSKEKIAALKKKLEATDNKSEKAALLMKLTDAYITHSQKEWQKILRKLRSQYLKWLNSDPEKRGREPYIDDFNNSSAELMRKASQVYRDLLNLIPEYNNDPFHLFKIASMQVRVNSPNAVLYLEKILKTSKSKSWKAKANLGLGEFYIYNRDFKRAADYYEQAIKLKISGVSEYANYKLMWLKVSQSGIENLRKVIPSMKSLASKTNGSDAFKYLATLASDDLVWLWSEMLNPEEGKRFFSANNNKTAYLKLLDRLVWKYQTLNDPKRASQTANILYKLEPGHQGQMATRFSLAHMFFANDDPSGCFNEIKEIAEILVNEKNPWLKANEKNPKVIALNRDRLESFILEKGIFYHSNYLKNQRTDYLAAASGLYQIYVKVFSSKDQVYNVRFSLAWTLENLGKYPEAVAEYQLVAQDSKQHHHQAESAARMVDLQYGIVEKTTFKPTPPLGTLKESIKIPPEKQKFIEVSDLFVKIFPKNDRSPNLRFVPASYYFAYGHYKEALTRFEQTVSTAATTNEARASVNVVLAYFDQLKDWEKLREWAEKFVKFEKQLGSETAALVIASLTKALWQIAEDLEKKQQNEPAAKSYITFASRLPADKNADLALYKALRLYFSEGMAKEGIDIGKRLLQQYSDSVYGGPTLQLMASAFQGVASYEQSAQAYEAFALRYPKDERAADSLYQAAVIYKALHNLDRASLVLFTLVSNFEKAKMAKSALLEYCEMVMALNQLERAVQGFNLFVKRYGHEDSENTLYAKVQMLILMTPPSVKALANEALRAIEAEIKSKPQTYAQKARGALAGYYLAIANGLAVDFSHQKVAYYDFNEYQSSIAAYRANLQNLEEIFQLVAQVGTAEYGSESYYRLGLVYETAYAAFGEKWNMDGLSPKEAQQITDAKERAIFEFNEKAAQVFEKSYLLAQKNGVYNKYRNLSYEKLTKLKPGSYKQMHENYLKTQWDQGG